MESSLHSSAQARRDGFSAIAVAHRGETAPEIENVADAVTWVERRPTREDHPRVLRAGVTQAVMAGGIRKARLFVNFRPDLRGARFLARVRKRDDDVLLRGIADELEQDGITIVESTACVPEILPGEGVLTRRAPTAAQWEDIRFGFFLAKEMGRLGVGQTVIIKDRVVVAVEAVEETDAAIERASRILRSRAASS